MAKRDWLLGWTKKFSYAAGTAIYTTKGGFSLNVAADVLCSDGRVRRTCRMSDSADTFFSTGAAVKVRGHYITGWIGCETASGSSVPMPEDPARLVFHAHTSHKWSYLLSEVESDCRREIETAAMLWDALQSYLWSLGSDEARTVYLSKYHRNGRGGYADTYSRHAAAFARTGA